MRGLILCLAVAGCVDPGVQASRHADAGAVCIADLDCTGRCHFSDGPDGTTTLAGRCTPARGCVIASEPGWEGVALCAA